jgi:hypothetical protein
VWRGAYEIPAVGERAAMPYEVDVESRECPVALVRQESLDWIQEFDRAQRVKEATGGVLYGPDSSEWPARWFDVVDLLQIETEREDRARNAALYSRR